MAGWEMRQPDPRLLILRGKMTPSRANILRVQGRRELVQSTRGGALCWQLKR